MKNREVLVEYELPPWGTKNERIPAKGGPDRCPNNCKAPTGAEERRLNAIAPEVEAYLEKIKTFPESSMKKYQIIRQLYRLSQKLQSELFVKTIQRALAYGVTDIETIERMAMYQLQDSTFIIDNFETDLKSNDLYPELDVSELPDLSKYDEVLTNQERSRLLRLRRAQIEEPFLLETYPFVNQPNVSKKKIYEIFDSRSYLSKKQNVIFVGPTGAGKTGLATALLIHAINTGIKGRFITFPDLLNDLYRSMADHSERKVMNKFIAYDCLVIDELGYIEINPDKAGMFFTLLKRRHRKATTIITTQLGFKEWTGFLKNDHLTSALVDRLLSNAEVINMNKCVSLRPTIEK